MDGILKTVLETVGAAVAPIIAGFVVALMVKGLSYLGLAVDAQKKAALETEVSRLVAQVAEWASRQAKVDGIEVAGAAKLEYFVALAAKKLPNVTPAEAEALAHQFLGSIRMGTEAVLGDVRKAVATPAAV